MPMTLNCPKCHKPFRVRDDSAGLRVKCPTCAAILQVPASLAPSSSDASKARPAPSPPAPVKKPAGQAVPAKTAKIGGDRGGESFFDDIPPSSTNAGPPSLPPMKAAHTQPLQRRPVETTERDDRSGKSKRSGRTSATGPLPTPKKMSNSGRKSGLKRRTESAAESERIIEDAGGWAKVRKGLGWVQFGFYLALLPAIAHFAVAAYCQSQENKIPDSFATAGIQRTAVTREVEIAILANRPNVAASLLRNKNQPIEKAKAAGFLVKSELSLWKEMEIVYAFGIPLLAGCLILIGLLGCRHIPDSARTRGTAGGTAFLTFLFLVGLATYAASILLPIFGQKDLLPDETKAIAWTLFVSSGLLSLGWICILLSQAGVPLRSTRTLRDTATTLLLVVGLIAAATIVGEFYPLLLSSPKMDWDRVEEIYLMQSGVILAVSVLTALRMASLASFIRNAINGWMEENKETLEAVAD